jgi:membrane protease YdiL (CAAX protease family)
MNSLPEQDRFNEEPIEPGQPATPDPKQYPSQLSTPDAYQDPYQDPPSYPTHTAEEVRPWPESPLPGGTASQAEPASGPLLFESWTHAEELPPARIPNFGHLLFLGLLAIIATILTGVLTGLALHFHVFGISSLNQAVTDVHYTLGTMAGTYVFTFLGCYFIFPLFWHKSFFAGLQWRAVTALRLYRRVVIAAFFCFVMAMLSGILMPGPQDTPIDKIFRTPGAAWLMFAFGVTFAPFFEEIVFRGFLLPALCTAYDWFDERVSGVAMLTPDENDHPRWSMPAMLVGSVLTSLPFALMHAEQTGWAPGPILLLLCVSLVLCWVRLSTRSLAASVLVHACYNFMLFSLMLVGTNGFRHLDRM